MVYLDSNATTPLAPEVLDAMLPFLRGVYGNPSSIHAEGRHARAAVDDSRERLADLLGARPHELIFTSGGTESCNLGVLGLAKAHRHLGRHVISAPTEHHAVLHAIEWLQHHDGFDVTMLPVDEQGAVSPSDLAEAIRDDTVLVTLMHANNETGTIQRIKELGAICRDRDVFFHTDAVQSFGKLPVVPKDLSVDAISLAAHKFYGPKGVGVLWLRAGIALTRLAHGGSHENSRRPGTENVPGIVGMAVAAELAESLREQTNHRLSVLTEDLWDRIQKVSPAAIRNGGGLANTLNVSFPGCDGEALLIALDIEGVGVSSGSACMVGSMQASHVLLAMGIDHATASATVRFSLGRSTSPADIEFCESALARALSRQSPTHNTRSHETVAV